MDSRPQAVLSSGPTPLGASGSSSHDRSARYPLRVAPQALLPGGLTREAPAEWARLSVRGIQDLERGVSQTPRPDTVTLLAAALGLCTPASPYMGAPIRCA